jgi:hypothetical protein
MQVLSDDPRLRKDSPLNATSRWKSKKGSVEGVSEDPLIYFLNTNRLV